MAAEDAGVIAQLKEWWPLLAALVTGVAGYVGAKKQLEARVASLETDMEMRIEDKLRADERHEALQRLVGDTVTSVARIEVAMKSVEKLPELVSDLRAALAKIDGRMGGRRDMG